MDRAFGQSGKWLCLCVGMGLTLVLGNCNPGGMTMEEGVVRDDLNDGGGDMMLDEPSSETPDTPGDDMLEGTENADYLGSLSLATVTVGEQEFLVWVADTFATLQRGLMFVTAEELADLPDGRGRGMLFSFEQDLSSGFWMKDTITPLDIAFIDERGMIVTIHTMAPLDESTYRPTAPYRHALEVNAGTFEALGVSEGQTIVLP